jgi:hypothetical protein
MLSRTSRQACANFADRIRQHDARSNLDGEDATSSRESDIYTDGALSTSLVSCMFTSFLLQLTTSKRHSGLFKAVRLTRRSGIPTD